MKYYCENLFSPLQGNQIIPDFKSQQFHVDCFWCKRRFNVPLMPDMVDWETVAKEYQKIAQDMAKDFRQIGADIEAMYGENPIAVYSGNRIRFYIEELMRRRGNGDAPFDT